MLRLATLEDIPEINRILNHEDIYRWATMGKDIGPLDVEPAFERLWVLLDPFGGGVADVREPHGPPVPLRCHHGRLLAPARHHAPASSVDLARHPRQPFPMTCSASDSSEHKKRGPKPPLINPASSPTDAGRTRHKFSIRPFHRLKWKVNLQDPNWGLNRGVGTEPTNTHVKRIALWRQQVAPRPTLYPAN